jgi:hypothetical protein
MIWFFAAVVLVLLVYSRGFRKFMAYCAMVLIGVGFVVCIAGAIYESYQQKAAATASTQRH